MINKKLLTLTMVASLVISGCANREVVSYGDATEVETVDIGFGSTDLQKIAAEMTDSLLISNLMTEFNRDGRPIFFVERVKNKTSEHIDTESITDSISTKLLRSGKAKLVDMSRVNEAKEQLKYQQDSGMVDQNSAIAFGQHVGAEYMLYGNLSSIVKSNKDKQDVYYKFTMRLMDLKTGLIEWADETEIRKNREKQRIGW
jgi:hypothetical protein